VNQSLIKYIDSWDVDMRKISAAIAPVLLAGTLATTPAFAAGATSGAAGTASSAGSPASAASPAGISSATVGARPGGVPTTGLATTQDASPAGTTNGNQVGAPTSLQGREQTLGIAPSPSQNRALNTAVEQDATRLLQQSQSATANLPPGVAQRLPRNR